MSQEVFPGVGTCRIDHVAIQVPYGMMIAASTLFARLGFKEVGQRFVSDWKNERHFQAAGHITLQLVEIKPTTSAPAIALDIGHGHVALAVANPHEVAAEIERWCITTAQTSMIDEEDGRYLICLPTILGTVSLELVAAGHMEVMI